MIRSLALALLSLLCVAPLTWAGQNWPQFRGPTGVGIADSTDLPETWGERQNVKWKSEVPGKAWSSPVVWGNQVWMTNATEDGHELYAVCLDRDTGKVVYNLKVFDIAHPQYCIPFNSYGSPTPCIEEGRLYVTFGSPGTACLDTHTGKVLWQRTDFVCNHYRGAGSSPLLYKDLLIMNFDGSDFQFVAALDKRTGRTVWRTDRDIDFGDVEPNGRPRGEGDFRKAFSTPRVFTIDGHDVVISLGSKALYAYEPLTGKELWRVEDKSSFSGSDTPIFGDGTIFYGSGHGQSELLAVKPVGGGEGGDIADKSIAWRMHKKVPTRSSLLLHDGLIYLVTDAGVVNCVNAKDGSEVWHGRVDGTYSASPTYGDGRIYLCSEQGKTTVLAAGREFKVLAENQLPDGIMASPAIAGHAIFIRTKTTVYRIEK
ncbi:MAG TPA: PQQ-binding-like beta-propeller repeat protein [Tepidisphaeraceae bacterium]|jgi:outer membrane protein assembly factor BamB